MLDLGRHWPASVERRTWVDIVVHDGRAYCTEQLRRAVHVSIVRAPRLMSRRFLALSPPRDESRCLGGADIERVSPGGKRVRHKSKERD